MVGQLQDTEIESMFGSDGVRLGRAIANRGDVTLQRRDGDSITAIVRGSRRGAYVVRIEIHRQGNEIAISDSCTCSWGGGCKHCVATLLVARSAAPKSSWKAALDGALPPKTIATEPVPTALLFERTTTKTTRQGAEPSERITVRPLRLGAKDKWIKSGVSWQDLESNYSYSYGRSFSVKSLDQAQLVALRTISAATGLPRYHSNPAQISVAQFGPMLWLGLQQAVDSGVVLLFGADHLGSVEIDSEPAHLAVDVTADGDGSVRLSTALLHHEAPLPLGQPGVEFIGLPAHGVAVAGPARLRLIPLARPLDQAKIRLATGNQLVIPPQEVNDFLDDYTPLLAEIASLGSSDGSFVLSATEFVGVVLRIDRRSTKTAECTWLYRYRRGGRLSEFPLRSFAGRNRDMAAEDAAIQSVRLPADLFAPLTSEGGLPRDCRVGGHQVVVLLSEVVPWLEEQSEVIVEIHGDLPTLRETTEVPIIALSVQDSSVAGNDWFDLRVEVSVEGEQIEFSELFAALTLGEESLILPSGTWLALDRPEFGQLRDLIEEAKGLADKDAPDSIRISRFQSSWWEDLCQLGIVEKQSLRWEQSVAQLREIGTPEHTPLPAGIHADLRHYQQEGFDWLAFLHRNRLGGILADDMGLGKTLQCLALCAHVCDENPATRVLVVAPTSVVQNWRREAAQFAPELAVLTVSETEPRRGVSLAEAVKDAQIVVTSYALFRIEFEEYQALGWEIAFFDEAQFLKNYRGKTYHCARQLNAEVKIAITGTPLENGIMDLWSLLSIAAPGLYADPKKFSSVFRSPIESGQSPEMLATLRRRIAPVMRRRTKEQVLAELPPKTESVVEVDLGAKHSQIYQTQLQRERQKVLGLVDNVQKNRFEIFKSLTLLRQLSLDPALVDTKHESVGSAKVDRLVSDLTEVIAVGHRALVFSQFTRYLSRVRKRLESEGIDYAYLDGRTRNREAAIAKFKEGEAPVFVISLKAGGVGLNLTEADYCFVLDPWWNPAVETQAVDRAHRIGQQNAVMVYRYVSVGTIEEKVMELKARKAALFSEVMDSDGALAGALTAEDIRGLFD